MYDQVKQQLHFKLAQKAELLESLENVKQDINILRGMLLGIQQAASAAEKAAEPEEGADK